MRRGGGEGVRRGGGGEGKAHLLEYVDVHGGTEFQFEVVESTAEPFAGRQRPAPQISILDVRKQPLHSLTLLGGDQPGPLTPPWGAAGGGDPLLPLSALRCECLVGTESESAGAVQGEGEEVKGEGGPATVHVQEAVEGGWGAVGAWKVL